MQQLLNFKTTGQGRSVVFLHGFLESNSMWEALQLDKRNFQSIMIDLPGHGLSKNEDNADEPSIQYMTNEVIKVIEHLKLNEFDIVGHSMGGYVALEVKKKLSICKKIVLLNSNFWEDSETKKKDRVRVASIVLKNKNLFLKEAIPNLYNNREKYKKEIELLLKEAMLMDEFGISYASLAMASRNNNKELIQRCPHDVFIIQGENDAIVQKEIMLDQLDELPVKMYLIENVGHMSHNESPTEISNLIEKIII